MITLWFYIVPSKHTRRSFELMVFAAKSTKASSNYERLRACRISEWRTGHVFEFKLEGLQLLLLPPQFLALSTNHSEDLLATYSAARALRRLGPGPFYRGAVVRPAISGEGIFSRILSTKASDVSGLFLASGGRLCQMGSLEWERNRAGSSWFEMEGFSSEAVRSKGTWSEDVNSEIGFGLASSERVSADHLNSSSTFGWDFSCFRIDLDLRYL